MKTILKLCASIALASSLHAAILTVDNNPGAVAQYTNFADAYAAAMNGDTILLAGSPAAYGNHAILKRLIIIGPGYTLGGQTLNRNTAKITISTLKNNFGETSENSRFIGLEVTLRDGANNNFAPHVEYDRCAVITTNTFTDRLTKPVLFRRCLFLGWGPSFSNGTEGSVISNSIFLTTTFSTGRNISLDGCVVNTSAIGSESGSSSIINTIFIKGVPTSLTQNVSLVNCMSVETNSLPNHSGNINGPINPLNVFVGGTSTDIDVYYRLKVGSPAIGSGLGGIDMGAFGGSTPYIPSGLPGIPRLTKLAVPTTATSTSGLRFEVSAQAFGE